jgi:NADPH:quinone reductase-like Zn-dependent oxidoreductase
VFTLLPLLTGVGRAHHGDILAAARILADAGELMPMLHDEQYDLASIAEAHRAVESGAATGKVVVNVAGA